MATKIVFNKKNAKDETVILINIREKSVSFVKILP